MYATNQADAYEISIHEAAKASTCYSTRHFQCYTNFNPRSRKGFDKAWFENVDIKKISIHEAAKASTKTHNMEIQ